MDKAEEKEGIEVQHLEYVARGEKRSEPSTG